MSELCWNSFAYWLIVTFHLHKYLLVRESIDCSADYSIVTNNEV